MLYTAIIAKSKLAFGVIVCRRNKQPRNGTGGLKVTCKDCIHYEACHDMYYEEHATRHFDPEKHNAEKECGYFKDRSRFVELPIKPGEKIFYFDTEGRIYETTVTQLVYGASGFLIDSDVMFNSNLIGERFFLTREEAERALKERENNG